MRILHILDHSLPLHSGYTFRTRAILEQQRRLGWETFHLTSSKQGGRVVAEETVEGLHFFRTPPVNGVGGRLPVLNQLLVMANLRRRLLDVVAQVRPDILHAHSPALNGLPAVRVGRRLGIPVVYEVRAFWEDAAVDHGTSREGGIRYRLTRALETFVLRKADAVTTICDGLRSDIVARGVPAQKVTVIPNAVDAETFTVGGVPDRALRQGLQLEDARVLGFIGSFYAYEGLTLLLRALPLVLQRCPEVRVLLVGGGPDEDRLRRLAAELSVTDKIRFVGRVPQREVQRYYDLIDVLVYPRFSMRLTELVTPLKPLEAMAQGRLLIASDVGGHRELIDDGRTGVLFKAGDAQALASKIVELLHADRAREEMRRAARIFVERSRTWEASVARYRAVYEPLSRTT